MRLGDYLETRFVKTDIQPGTVRSVLSQLVEVFQEEGAVVAGDELLASLLERESLQSTGIGYGVAVPHAICDDLDRPRVALGLCREGVDFQALDEEPVHLFFMLLSPSENTRTHIKLLARMARMVRHPELLDTLRSCKRPEELVEEIRAYEDRHV